MEFVQLGKSGSIIKTGNARFQGKRDYVLHFYTAEGELVWEKKVETETQAFKTQNITIATPDGSIVYNIEVDDSRLAKYKQYLTQITRTGVAKKMEIDKPEMGKSLLSIFCDENYLYYLCSENGNELHKKKKVTEKLILNRFSHASLTHKKMELAMPAITDGELSTFWTLAGQNGKIKYLTSKVINPKEAQQKFHLVSIDPEGNIVNRTSIDFDTKEKWVRPAVSESLGESKVLHNGSYNLVDVNFENSTYVQTSTFKAPGAGASPALTTSSVSESAIMMNGSFSYLHLDAVNDALYIYGLLGPRPVRKVAPGFNGFYVYKYNLAGRAIWKLVDPGSKDLLDEKFYTTHGMAHHRNIGLFLKRDQNATFSISFYRNRSATKRLYLFEIDTKGQLINTRSSGNDDSGEWSSALSQTISSKSKDYLNKKMKENGKDLTPMFFPSEVGEMLLILDQKNRKLNVLYFKI